MRAVYIKPGRKIFILHIQKLETAINQTPISSIGRKAPLPVCMHVAYECKLALCIMNVTVSVEKVKGFSIKKPYAVVRATKSDNKLLSAMFGYNNTYIATFNILLTANQKDVESEDFDLNDCFKQFKKLVNENVENFKCYDFLISDLTNGLCSSVLIVSTKQTMSMRRVLALVDKESAFNVTKQAVLSAITKKRYKPLNVEEIEKLQNAKAKSNDETEDDEEE